jgi:hypothetical protein
MRPLRCLFTLSVAFLLASSANAAAPPQPLYHPLNVWVRQSPRDGAPVPGFVYEGSGAYDPFIKKWIHHAGHDGIPQGFHTFTFDLGSGRWRQHFPPTSPPGVCCVDGTNAFDLANRRFVRFPGGSLGHGYQYSRGVKLKESAVWLYDGAANTWTNMRPTPYKVPDKGGLPVGGLDSGAVYVPDHEVTLTFGGQGSGGGKNTLYAYDAHANALHRLDGPNPPSPRDGMGMAYDPRHGKLVVFGSQYSSDEKTWLYDLKSNRWEGLLLEPHPPAVKATKEYSTMPRMAYDPNSGLIVCIVWLADKGHQTWTFDAGKRRWTQTKAAKEPDPSKSRSRNIDYDRGRNLFILETSGAESNRPEVWTYRLRERVSSNVPAAPADVRVRTHADRAVLTWSPSVTPGVKKYEVHRGTGELPWRIEFEKVATTEATRYEDRDVKAGTVYTYVVKAAGGDASLRARTRPRVPGTPVVSVLAKDRIEVTWDRHSESDVVGYNLYRGVATVRTVKQGEPKAWRDNDPAYEQPTVVQVRDVTQMKKLNDKPLTKTTFTDGVDLTKKGKEAEDYRYAVHAYVVRAVNKLGVESGPSPYALTLPSEPLNVLCREQGEVAELKWDKARENGVSGYHVYKLDGTWKIVRVTDRPLKETTYRYKVGKNAVTRFWVAAIDAMGQEGQPSSPAWFGKSYRGFYDGEWHQ